jgi:predicted amino acid-binding ACT domain protein
MVCSLELLINWNFPTCRHSQDAMRQFLRLTFQLFATQARQQHEQLTQQLHKIAEELGFALYIRHDQIVDVGLKSRRDDGAVHCK